MSALSSGTLTMMTSSPAWAIDHAQPASYLGLRDQNAGSPPPPSPGRGTAGPLGSRGASIQEERRVLVDPWVLIASCWVSCGSWGAGVAASAWRCVCGLILVAIRFGICGFLACFGEVLLFRVDSRSPRPRGATSWARFGRNVRSGDGAAQTQTFANHLGFLLPHRGCLIYC